MWGESSLGGVNLTTAYQFFEFEVPSAWYNSEVQQGLEIHGLSEGNPATVFGSKKLGGFRKIETGF